MGCDIHSYLEIRKDDHWRHATGDVLSKPDQWSGPGEVFPLRSYGLFGFLADVRNYSHAPVIAEPRGLPIGDADGLRAKYGDGMDRHSASWLTVAELLAYDYDQMFWDRRVTRGNNGPALAEEGEGRHLSLRDFLGEWYFRRLNEVAALGTPEDVRVVFWFDN